MKITAIRRLLLLVFLIPTIATALAYSQAFDVLYSFTGGQDGSSPTGWLAFDGQGHLFGATTEGGVPDCPLHLTSGCGTLFRIGANGEAVVHRFYDGVGGGFPGTGLVRRHDGIFYGSTNLGSGASAGGVIYAFDPKSGHTTVVYAFAGGATGRGPNGVIFNRHGNLYGTTVRGGNKTTSYCRLGGCGLVFKIFKNGQEDVLHRFVGPPDGSYPRGSLVQDSQGSLYGVTNSGGAAPCNCGTIFKIDTHGNETILHSFSDSPDGSTPDEGLMLDSQGDLYGTTWNGGPFGAGTVYKLDPAGNLTVLYSFSGTDGTNPSSSLVSDAAGNLYGFTYAGGDLSCGFEGSGCGTVFRIDPNGNLTTLHAFTATATDGWGANGGHLLLDATGQIYGLTFGGGTAGYGVVYRITQ